MACVRIIVYPIPAVENISDLDVVCSTSPCFLPSTSHHPFHLSPYQHVVLHLATQWGYCNSLRSFIVLALGGSEDLGWRDRLFVGRDQLFDVISPKLHN